jgi:hypothetical protein
MYFDDIALHVPTILLPRRDIPLDKWAVIACDQYTSQPEYWEKVRRIVGRHPSTLHLIFPEVYLDTADRERVIAEINRRMEEYLSAGVLVEQAPGLVLVERHTGRGTPRRGLVVALDLEEYEYRKGARTLIRTTEGTVLERLPPRVQIRENASLETPHILVLIDDPDHTVIEPLLERDLEQIYEAELMLGGGRVRGFRVADPALIEGIARGLARLAHPEAFAARYQVNGQPPLLYALGDGNHSFATAKAIWEKIKAQLPHPRAAKHPARYALVELVNVHDQGLEFSPIHRVIFGAPLKELQQRLEAFFAAQGAQCCWRFFALREEWERARAAPAREGEHRLPFLSGDQCGLLTISRPRLGLAVAALQAFLDHYARQHPLASVDYIHGAQALAELAARPGGVGFLLPALDKRDLFRTIILEGALPRKSFSLGEAAEKRYYLECRRLRP